jgi:hypothetical protein
VGVPVPGTRLSLPKERTPDPRHVSRERLGLNAIPYLTLSRSLDLMSGDPRLSDNIAGGEYGLLRHPFRISNLEVGRVSANRYQRNRS